MSDKLAPTDRHRFEQDGTPSNFVFLPASFVVVVDLNNFCLLKFAHLENGFSSFFQILQSQEEPHLNTEQLRSGAIYFWGWIS